MNLLVLLLTAFPLCLAQFSIQGPSDGNRQAQGLKVSDEKGIEYTSQDASQGAGDFTIQGATDGSSNFQIQGAVDGHSNFQIQGPSDGGADRYNFQGAVSPGAYNIQGATDGHSQSVIQGPYDANQGTQKSLQYNDPSGLRVNWQSFDRQSRVRPQQEQQYVEPAAPVPHRVAHRQRQRVQASAPAAQQAPAARPVYRTYDQTPPQIKQLLEFQAQIPYLNSIPEPFRYESLLASQGKQQQQYRNEEVSQEPQVQRPQYRTKARGHSRQRRQAPQRNAAPQEQPQYRRISQPPAEPQVQYNTKLPAKLQQLLKFQSQTPYVSVIPEQYRYDAESAARQQVQQVQAHYSNLGKQLAQQGRSRQRRQAPRQKSQLDQQYRRIPQPPAEQLPQYSTNIPGHLQQLLKFQSQIPYNIIANQIQYRLDKPYVPQPVQPSAPAQQAQYQGQGNAQSYEPDYSQAQAQYPQARSQYPQAQAQYPQYNQGGVRPVKENQY